MFHIKSIISTLVLNDAINNIHVSYYSINSTLVLNSAINIIHV